MAAKSGKWGYATVDGTDIKEFTDWDYSHGQATQTYASRAGGGAEQTEAGVESGGGSISGIFDPDDPDTATLTTGSLVELYLYHADSISHSGYARLGQRKFGVSRSGENQTYSVDFTQHGEWSHPGE